MTVEHDTGLAKLAKNPELLKVLDSAEQHVLREADIKKLTGPELQSIITLLRGIDESKDTNKQIRQRLKTEITSSPEDEQNAVLFTQLSDLLAAAQQNMPGLEEVLASQNPEEALEAMKKVLQDQVKAKVMVNVFGRLTKFFKGNLSKLKDIQAFETKFKIESTNKSILGKMKPETMQFLSSLTKTELDAADVLQLSPMLVQILTDPEYLIFVADMKGATVITPPPDLNNPDQPSAESVKTSLSLGSLESDLVLMFSSNEKLYRSIINSMNESFPQDSKAIRFGLTHSAFLERSRELESLGAALKVALSNARVPESARLQAAEATPPETTSTEQLRVNARMDELRFKLSQNETAQKPFNDKYSKGRIEVEELKDLRDLQLEHSRMVYELSKLQNSFVREDSKDNNIFNVKEATFLNSMANEFVEDIKGLDAIATKSGSLTEAQSQDRRSYTLAERFLRENISLDNFLNKYYATTFAEERANVIVLMQREYAQKGKVFDEKLELTEIDRRAALATRDATELMLQTIVIKMYTSTIEAGGEPDTPFDRAVQRAKTSFGYNPKLLVDMISKVLTGYKTEAAKLRSDQHLGPSVNYASPFHEVYDEKNLKAGQRKTSMNQRVDYKCGSSAEDIKMFTNSLERQFDTFERAIEGHYMLRYWTNAADGKYYEHMINEGSEYVKSDTFDIIHLMKDGEVVAKYLPALKSIMDDFFAQYGWVIGMKLDQDPTGHQTTLFTVFKEYLEKYYPELSDMQQRKFAYLAFHQAYSHGYFQQMLSRSRTTAGYQGKLFDRANALHNIHYNGYMFAYNSAEQLTNNKHWARGARVLPAWYTDMVKMNPLRDPTGRIENISETVPYGALIEFGTNHFGHFLTRTNDHFNGTITKSMMPYNFFGTGSDDNYRGWRQVNKAIGNLATNLWERAPFQDDVKLSGSYKNADHYTLIWKSVENVGANYVRTFVDAMIKNNISYDGKGQLKDKNKIQHLFQFLYRRYLSEGVGKHLISEMPEFTSVTTDAAFWDKLLAKFDANKDSASSIADDIFYRVYTVMMAERNPMTLVNKVTRWTTQTGSTLFDEVRTEFSNLSDEQYSEIRRDIITVQTEARARVTSHITSKRQEWETQPGSLDRNIYGDFSQDRSAVSITGEASDRGYVVNEKTIDVILRAQLKKNIQLSPTEIETRVANAKKLYTSAMGKFVQRVKLPEYEELRSFFKASAKSAYSDFFKGQDGVNQEGTATAPIFAAIEKDHPGASYELKIELFGEYLFRARVGATKEEYEAKYRNGLTSHANWWVKLWKDRYFGMEPESDFSEALTTYRNSDVNHLTRMADMSQSTSVYIKSFLDNPDDEKSLETAAKDFSKDPRKTIDTFSGFLNPFRKILENQIGKDEGIRFINYYTLTAIDATLKEDRYRAGFSGAGFMGIYRDVLDLVWGGTRKMSLGSERYQQYHGKSLTAADANGIARYLVEKKLSNAEAAEKIKARIHGTIPDIMYEAAPFLAIFLMLSIANEILEKMKEELPLDEKKQK